MKKTLAIILCAVMAALAGCGSQTSDTPAPLNGDPDTASADVTEAAETESEQQKYIDALPEADYEGYNFRMLVHEDATAWGTVSYYAEEENGELLNDFIFRRNLAVSEKYNINITAEQTGDVAGKAKKFVTAGDDAYDMLSEYVKSILQSAVNGYYYNLYSVPGINLENPWWDAGCRDLLTINDRLYVAFSDMNVHPLDLLSGNLMVNNQLAENLGYGPTTHKALDGAWTFDVMQEMINAASADIDGSGTMDQNDQFGFIAGVGDISPMIVSSGRQYLISEDGVLKLNYGSESVIAAAEKMDPIINNKATTVYLNEQGWGYEVFKAGRALFRCSMIGSFFNEMRGLELDISLIPDPKFDEAQERYHSMMSNCSMGVTVPASVSDPERVGNIIEALGAHSYIAMDEVYYETTLQVKLARNEDSRKILELLVEARTPDLCVFNENAYGTVLTSFLDTFHRSGAANLASLAEKNAEKFAKVYDKIVTAYDGLPL